jgi:hypothetical protein
MHRSSSFEAQQSFSFIQQAAAQGHPRAAISFALAKLYSAAAESDVCAGFNVLMTQAMKGQAAAQHGVGELMCSGCGCQCRCFVVVAMRLHFLEFVVLFLIRVLRSHSLILFQC